MPSRRYCTALTQETVKLVLVDKHRKGNYAAFTLLMMIDQFQADWGVLTDAKLSYKQNACGKASTANGFGKKPAEGRGWQSIVLGKREGLQISFNAVKLSAVYKGQP